MKRVDVNTPRAVAFAAGLAALALALLLLSLAPASASAELTFCQDGGSEAGQCVEPRGVATDFANGRVYLADRGNHRIDVFDATGGTFLFAFGWKVNKANPEEKLQVCTIATGCQKGSQGVGAGQFSRPVWVAVDNVAGGATRHDLYVTDDNFRISRFAFEADGSFAGFERAFGWGVDTGAPELESCTTVSSCQVGIKGGGECQLNYFANLNPVAVGPGGSVFVGDSAGNEPNFTNRVQKFSPTGACMDEAVLLEGDATFEALAVNSAEEAWVSFQRVPDQLRRYRLSDAVLLCSPYSAGNTNALALDEEDRLYASQQEPRVFGGALFKTVATYDPACNPLHRFAYGQIDNSRLAYFESPGGDLVASEVGAGRRVHYLEIPPPGPITATALTDAVGGVKAKVRAEVNPEGKATEVHVEYVTRQHFDEEGFANPQESDAQTITPGAPPAGYRAEGLEFQLGCVDPEEGGCLSAQTEYLFRVVATNADNPTGAGEATTEGSPFTTLPHLGITWASEVGPDSARLSAEADPFGLPTTAYFEYVEEATFQQSGFAQAKRFPDPQPPAEEAPLDFGAGEGAQTRSVVLAPLGAGTAYRYRLVIEDPFGTETGDAGSFRTFATETPATCPNDALRLGAAALLPDCRAYEMVSPVDKEGGEIAVQVEATSGLPATLNQASTSGGRLAYGSYRAFGDSESAPYTAAYISTRGEAGWQSRGISPHIGEPIAGGVVLDNEFRAFDDDLCEGWLTRFFEPALAKGAVPGYFTLYRRKDQLCGGVPDFETVSVGKPLNQKPEDIYRVELQGHSADGQLAAFAANDALAGTGAPANPGGKIQLYLKAPGKAPAFACILPGGSLHPGACQAGTGRGVLFGKHRVGNFTNALSADGTRLYWTAAADDGPIYLRQNHFGSGAECSGSSAPCTLPVSGAGEKQSGSSASHFWAAAGDGSRAIFTTGGSLNSGSADLYEFALEGKSTTKIAGDVYGVVGASADATRVYFASEEVLSGSEENSEGDKAQSGRPNLYRYEAGEPPSYAFVGTLAAADVDPGNARGASGLSQTEPIDHNGRVSSDGQHTAFMSVAPLTGYDNTDAVSGEADAEVFVFSAVSGELSCVSCNPGEGRPVGMDTDSGSTSFWIAARLPVYVSTLHAPRVLSEDGSRVFFESADPLVARDANGRIDVYQWERVGSGGEAGCEESDATFSPAAGGCISLISSGQSERDSQIVDADPDGENVFFTTLSSLVPQDPGLIDIYDARVGGGFAAPEPPAGGCEGEACQGAYVPPSDPTPASASFRGAGNLTETRRPRRCPRGSKRVRRKGRARCVSRAKQNRGKATKTKSAGRRDEGRR